jgi:hypothetical protein
MKSGNYCLVSLMMNLGLPGLGHLFCREYLFGIFIFLIMLITAVLFFVSFFLSLSFWPKAILLTLPTIFYVFTFVDLYRVVRLKQPVVQRSRGLMVVFLAVAMIFQLLAPITPLNFAIRNFPQIFVLGDGSLSPVHSRGDLLKASRLAYSVNIFFVKRPIFHALPHRYDLVRFMSVDGQPANGIVTGLPGESVQMVDGVLVVNGMPVLAEPAPGLVLTGDWPLTNVDTYSILVATLHLGTVDAAFVVPLSDLVGKIDKAF